MLMNDRKASKLAVWINIEKEGNIKKESERKETLKINLFKHEKRVEKRIWS